MVIRADSLTVWLLCHFHFHFVVLQPGAVKPGDDGVGVLGGNVDEQMPIADVDGADNAGRQTGFARNRLDDIHRRDAHFTAEIHVEPCLVGWGAAAMFRWEASDGSLPVRSRLPRRFDGNDVHG